MSQPLPPSSPSSTFAAGAPPAGPGEASAPSDQSAAVDAAIRDAFASAQQRTIAAVAEVVRAAQAGQRAADLERALSEAALSRGFSGWFRPPLARVAGVDGQQGGPALRPGHIVELRLMPLDPDAYGAFGYSFRFGAGEEPAALRDARELSHNTCGFASRWKSVGELFVYATSWANNRRRSLGEARAIGHQCFPRRGRAGWLWPYASRSASSLRRHEIQWLNPRRMRGHYFVAPRLVAGAESACFGELILVDGDHKSVVGRAGRGEIGTLPD